MTKFAAPPRGLVLVGDALQRLQQLPDESIDSVVTSPPYFRLRDYQVVGQIGLEAAVDDWVLSLRRVLEEVRRVLVPTGTVWLNLGDSYSTHQREGAPRKSLLLGPERLALLLIADGWTVRNKIVWAKTNTRPTSVRDRLATKWEAVYLLAKQPVYYFDLDAIREPHVSSVKPQQRRARTGLPEPWRGPHTDTLGGLRALKMAGIPGHPLGKNPGDVWRLATGSYRSASGAHHATFPLALAARTILAGTPEARCTTCHAPWRRALTRHADGTATRGDLRPVCTCGAPSEPGLVLDVFLGSGTTAVAAQQLGRDWLGIELNPAFARMAEERIAVARRKQPPTPAPEGT